MDTRKPYTTPAIAAEDTLEQTSLACDMTQQVLADVATCPEQSQYFKGSGWDVFDWNCASPILAYFMVCSVFDGVVLS